jgi:virginiamycin B lyase
MRASIACAVAVILNAAVAAQTVPASSPARAPDEIAFSRLKADAIVPVPLAPGAAATADGVAMPTDAGVVWVTASSNGAAPPVLVGQRPCAGLVAALGSLWVPLCDHGRIARLDDKTRGVGLPVELAVADPHGRVAAGVGSLWVVSDARGIVSRIDPDSGQVVAEIRVAAEPSSIAFADDALWITSVTGDGLTLVNAHTNEVVATTKVGPRPGRLAVGEGAVWVLNRGDGSVSRVDPKSHKVEATLVIGNAAADGEIAAGEGSVWVSATGLPLVRIDPRANRVAQRFTGAGGGAVVVAHGSVWVAADAGTTWRLDPRLIAAMRP